jgi:hypothetical protein
VKIDAMSKPWTCRYCKSKLSTKGSLTYHQKTAQYCLKIQGKSVDNKFTCHVCSKKYIHKHKLTKHLEKCKEVEEDMLGKSNEKLKNRVNKLRDKNKVFVDEIKDLKRENNDLKKTIHELEKKLSEQKGMYEGYNIAAEKYKPKTVNRQKITYNNKLLSIATDNIRPLTIETVDEDVNEGKFTREMFERGISGILEFVSNIITLKNDEGKIERNYACTDSSRHKFHRLIKSKEWQEDNGAHFLNEILDQLKPSFKQYFLELIEEKIAIRENAKRASTNFTEEEDIDFVLEIPNAKINRLEPIYDGIMHNPSEDRDKLFASLRTRISKIAAV